jgi:hypothetical protein
VRVGRPVPERPGTPEGVPRTAAIKRFGAVAFQIIDRPRSFAVFSASPNYRGRCRNAATGYVVGNVLESCAPHSDRSHALRGNAARDALRPCRSGRGASGEAFPRGAWERSVVKLVLGQLHNHPRQQVNPRRHALYLCVLLRRMNIAANNPEPIQRRCTHTR